MADEKIKKKTGRAPKDASLKKTNRVVVLLDDGLYAKAVDRAQDNHMTMSAYISNLILNDNKGGPK